MHRHRFKIFCLLIVAFLITTAALASAIPVNQTTTPFQITKVQMVADSAGIVLGSPTVYDVASTPVATCKAQTLENDRTNVATANSLQPRNKLIGDYQQINPAPTEVSTSVNFDVQSNPMVHIRAIPEGGLSLTNSAHNGAYSTAQTILSGDNVFLNLVPFANETTNMAPGFGVTRNNKTVFSTAAKVADDALANLLTGNRPYRTSTAPLSLPAPSALVAEGSCTLCICNDNCHPPHTTF